MFGGLDCLTAKRRLHKEARSPLGTRRAERSEARMAELVYAFDLKSNGEIHMGSSPISGTIFGYEEDQKDKH